MSGSRAVKPGTATADSAQPTQGDPRRWGALAVLAAIQFMLMMDVTVVNIALPHIQRSLHFSVEGLTWVVDGYLLTAGGFLLLGGRLADMFGRRRMLIAGVLTFGIASMMCGFAGSSGVLVTGRLLQGMGEALAGPAALGLIPLLFTDPRERMKALGAWGGVAALGSVVGSIVGGLITEAASWRWVFFINVPVVLLALILVPRYMRESRMDTGRGQRLDVPGAVGVTGALVAIVYGLIQAADKPWGSGQVLVPLIGGVLLLVLTAVWEARTPDPIIPLRFFTNRTRVTSNGASMMAYVAFYTYAFLLTLFLQSVLGYSPMRTGLTYIPLTFAIATGMGLSTALMPRIGVRMILVIAFAGSACGLLVAAAGLRGHAGLAWDIIPGLVIYGFFNGVGYPALTNGALHEVTGQDSGLASGTQTAMQQIGASLGLAVLVPVAVRYVKNHVASGTAPAVAQAHGYALSLRLGALVLVVTAVLVAFLVGRVEGKPRNPAAEASDDSLASNDGVASNGVASNSVASNGVASNSVASNGVASNGLASDGDRAAVARQAD
jgi:EmrB/QacA subfamily drug resistance transporter